MLQKTTVPARRLAVLAFALLVSVTPGASAWLAAPPAEEEVPLAAPAGEAADASEGTPVALVSIVHVDGSSDNLTLRHMRLVAQQARFDVSAADGPVQAWTVSSPASGGPLHAVRVETAGADGGWTIRPGSGEAPALVALTYRFEPATEGEARPDGDAFRIEPLGADGGAWTYVARVPVMEAVEPPAEEAAPGPQEGAEAPTAA